MTDDGPIRFRVEGPVATIELNRPDAGNSLNMPLVQELTRAALACDTDPTVKAVLLSGGQGRMFCAGGDLKTFSQFGAEAGVRVRDIADELHRALSIFARMAAPLVVAINGTAAGAGFSLALAGDFVLAAKSAKFTMAYTAAGLSPDGGSSYALPRLVGLRRAQDLMLTNRVLSAEEAADWGIVSRVVADEALGDEARAACRRIAAGSGTAHAAVKRLLLASSRNGPEEQMALESREISAAVTSPDGAEGIAAFAAKRKPNFR